MKQTICITYKPQFDEKGEYIMLDNQKEEIIKYKYDPNKITEEEARKNLCKIKEKKEYEEMPESEKIIYKTKEYNRKDEGAWCPRCRSKKEPTIKKEGYGGIFGGIEDIYKCQDCGNEFSKNEYSEFKHNIGQKAFHMALYEVLGKKEADKIIRKS